MQKENKMNEGWRQHLESLSQEDKNLLLNKVMNVLMRTESEVGYRSFVTREYEDEPDQQEGFYWTSCGDLILKKDKP